MSPRDVSLQKLHDGELAPAEAEALHAELTDEDRQKLAALAEIDQAVSGALEGAAAEAPLDLWAGIAAQLPAAAPTPERAIAAPGNVVPLLARRRRFALRATAVMSALAMAASLMLWMRAGPRTSDRCDVEELEVAGASATVLTLPGERGNDTTLIWVDHDDNDEWESL